MSWGRCVAGWVLAGLLTAIGAQPSMGQDGSATRKPKPTGGQALSLRSIFHPKDAVDFDGRLPQTRWIGDSPSILLIKQSDGWKQMKLDAGESGVPSDDSLPNESPVTDSPVTEPWPLPERLTASLETVAGIDRKAAARAIRRAVGRIKDPQAPVIARIGKQIAVVTTKTAQVVTADGSAWSHLTLDPTGRWLGYCQDSDFFVREIATGTTRRLTNDQSESDPSAILDGELEWMYQEEIFGRGQYKGFWFAPDGQSVAMMRIDTRDIPPFVLGSSTDSRGDGGAQRYSKPGDPIPRASLLVWDLSGTASVATQSTTIHSFDPKQETLITGVWWNPHDGALWFCISDRKQTYRKWKVFRRGQSVATTLIHESSPAWVEPPAAPVFSKQHGVIMRSEVPEGVYRIYRIAQTAGGRWERQPLTPESINVDEFGIDSEEQLLWFTADYEGQRGRHVYRVKLNQPQPLLGTIDAIERVTTQQGWHSVRVSGDGKWLTDRYSTRNSPPSLSVRRLDGNAAPIQIAQTQLQTTAPLIRPNLLNIPTPDGGTIPAMIVRPPSTGADDRFPVVVEIYGGPYIPVVEDRWGGQQSLYRQWLAQLGIATMVVDNRSSAGKSMADSWPVKGKLGRREFADVMTAAQWLKAQPWTQPDRIAIRGWSFGGYLTLYAMMHSDTFAAGIAGGSVTDWRDYDAFYTERYMGLPVENETGYQQTSLIPLASQLSGKLLMVHGEVDDNVHPSNSLKMARALQKADKDFRLMIYPDAKHGVVQPQQRWHLRRMTHEFLMEHLMSEKSPGK